MRETAPLRLARRDPLDYTRLVVHNERNGYVDNGAKFCGASEYCHNCRTPDSMMSTVSLHFCKCGAIFNYWAGGGNAKWNVHAKLEESSRNTQTWYDEVADYNDGM